MAALIWPSTLAACAFSGESDGNLSHKFASSVEAARSCRRTCPSSDFSTAVILALGHTLDDPTVSARWLGRLHLDRSPIR
jgi:hypothetical protein